jgi:hypothetical protein
VAYTAVSVSRWQEELLRQVQLSFAAHSHQRHKAMRAVGVAAAT